MRIDGRGFHKLSSHYNFSKPNDVRALDLMNAAAVHVVRSLPDICFAYGVSDEFSFVFERGTVLFERRSDKLVSTVVSTFTAAYVLLWPQYFKQDSGEGSTESTPQTNALDAAFLPTFDGRAVVYPSTANLRDYLAWRQVDCHINNLYNTTFWSLVMKGELGQREAEEFLKGTVSSDKNEILFSRFDINYNNEPEMFRKGSSVFRDYSQSDSEGHQDRTLASTAASDSAHCTSDVPQELSKTQQEKQRKIKSKAQVVVRHVDIIKDDFWHQHPRTLAR